MALSHKPIAYWRRKRSVPNLQDSMPVLQEWFESPVGRQMLVSQQRQLDQALSCLFGYHLMQLSVHRSSALYQNSRVCHCFKVGAEKSTPAVVPDEHSDATPMPRGAVGAISNLDALPFEDETVDVTVLHHVLDFSNNPHQVLREASRVTIARGYIIVIGFNPFGPMGMIKPIAQLLSNNPIWRRNSLRPGRITDWLKFLDCNVVSTQSGAHFLPIDNPRLQSALTPLAKMAERSQLPFGNFYCLVARKDRTAMTPIKPKWLSQPQLAARPKQAISARSAAKLAVIKGSKPDLPNK